MRHLVRIAALCCALMAPAAGAADYCAALQGAADLDMHKWRVMSVPPMAAARAQRLHGRYAFQASLGDVVYKLGFAMVEGFPWPQPLDKEAYQRLRSIALRPGDVIVASYPKSGTTWMEQIVLLLQHGSGVANRLDPKSRNEYNSKTGVGKIWLEPYMALGHTQRKAVTREAFDAIRGPRLIKSHAPVDLVVGFTPARRGAPTAVGAKVIYVARNPKDAAVSLFYQRAPAPRGTERRMTLDAWVALYTAGFMSCGNWAEHVARWHAASLADANVLFVTYEQLSKEPMQTLRRVSNFLGLKRNETELEAVFQAATFEAMSSQAASAKRRRGLKGTRRLESRRLESARPGFAARLRALVAYAQRRGGVSLSAGRRALRGRMVGALSPQERNRLKFAVAPGGLAADATAGASHLRQGGVGGWRIHFSAALAQQFDASVSKQLGEEAKRAAVDFGVSPDPPTFDSGACDDAAGAPRRWLAARAAAPRARAQKNCTGAWRPTPLREPPYALDEISYLGPAWAAGKFFWGGECTASTAYEFESSCKPQEPYPAAGAWRSAAAAFCAAFDGSRVLFVGDSLNGQMFTSMVHLLGAHKGVQNEDGLRCADVDDAGPHEIALRADVCARFGGNVSVQFLRNEFLTVDAAANQAQRELYAPAFPKALCLWGYEAARADVVVLNRGVHFIPSPTFDAQLEKALDELKSLRARAGRSMRGVVYRSTHAITCSAGDDAPAATPFEPPSTHDWDAMAAQNAIAERLVLARGAQYLDVYSMSALRPGGRKDCVHLCLPGHMDDWNFELFRLATRAFAGRRAKGRRKHRRHHAV
ncbi:P-loop containing nucleoside triphosphate hydrolase protein [Pelagophyceae sp. CCMP2097]|nr:P-loop containing nucleoside triphosphate hydrolase protein [Pelagophyceae sp. CCMP2097]